LRIDLYYIDYYETFGTFHVIKPGKIYLAYDTSQVVVVNRKPRSVCVWPFYVITYMLQSIGRIPYKMTINILRFKINIKVESVSIYDEYSRVPYLFMTSYVVVGLAFNCFYYVRQIDSQNVHFGKFCMMTD